MYIVNTNVVVWDTITIKSWLKGVLFCAPFIVSGFVLANSGCYQDQNFSTIIIFNVNTFFLLIYLSVRWIKMIINEIIEAFYSLKRLNRSVKEWKKKRVT